MSTRKLPAASWRSRRARRRRSRDAPESWKARSPRPTSRPGTSASCPDGTGLPPGSGTPAEGARIYAAKCAAVPRRERQRRARRRALVGGAADRRHRDDEDDRQLLAVRDDAVRLHSPRDAVAAAANAHERRSLRAHRVHLSLNKIIGENDAMNAQTLPKVRMPNRDGFIIRFPERLPSSAVRRTSP